MVKNEADSLVKNAGPAARQGPKARADSQSNSCGKRGKEAKHEGK